jgi:hypothetical protein
MKRCPYECGALIQNFSLKCYNPFHDKVPCEGGVLTQNLSLKYYHPIRVKAPL